MFNAPLGVCARHGGRCIGSTAFLWFMLWFLFSFVRRKLRLLLSASQCCVAVVFMPLSLLLRRSPALGRARAGLRFAGGHEALGAENWARVGFWQRGKLYPVCWACGELKSRGKLTGIDCG